MRGRQAPTSIQARVSLPAWETQARPKHPKALPGGSHSSGPLWGGSDWPREPLGGSDTHVSRRAGLSADVPGLVQLVT